MFLTQSEYWSEVLKQAKMELAKPSVTTIVMNINNLIWEAIEREEELLEASVPS